LFKERGVKLVRTYQLNFGGNTDFLNMLERERLESKKISKTNAVTSQLPEPLPAGDVYVGPSDHVPWLGDRKWCYIRMEGTTFGNVPLNCELKLEVWDSPNSAGVVIDAIRCVKLALDRGIGGPLVGPASYFMKSPPQQFTDYEDGRLTEAFINNSEAEPARRSVRNLPRKDQRRDDDRSHQVVERTQQPVALGFSPGPRMEGVFRNGKPRRPRRARAVSKAKTGPGRDLAN
jgi:myo-inositol-1-phosphate synthase